MYVKHDYINFPFFLLNSDIKPSNCLANEGQTRFCLVDVGQARSLPQHPSTKPLDFYQLTWARAYKLLCSEDGTACVIGCAHRHGAARPRGGTAGYPQKSCWATMMARKRMN